MKHLILALLTATFIACDVRPEPDTSSTDTSSSSSGAGTGDPTDGPGYVCEDVGVACDLEAPSCSAGLDCIERPDMPGTGVCAAKCNLDGGANGQPCPIGWCDLPAGESFGICRDNDGLPTGLCDGVPSCAGDHCTDACANGLACISGACAFACETAKDCAAGQACLAGACFAGDGLADPCN